MRSVVGIRLPRLKLPSRGARVTGGNTLKAIWTEYSSSQMSSVAPSPVPNPGGTAYSTVMSAWSGGAFGNGELLVWGGGHNDYGGNEVYAFNVTTGVWRRVTNPASNTIISGSGNTENTGYYAVSSGSSTPDLSQPRARHTYNLLVYSDAIDRFISLFAMYYYPTVNGANALDILNTSNGTWSQGTGAPAAINYQAVSDVDPNTGKVWIYGGGSNGFLMSYNPSTDTWAQHGDIFSYINEVNDYQTGVIDPVNQRFYVFGDGTAKYWPLNPGTGSIAAVAVTSTGPSTIEDAQAPGLQYHATSGLIIGWNGGQTVYGFNPSTNVWATIPLSSLTSSVTPSSVQTNGTFGRFRRFATNKFVAVNATNENVYALELVYE